MLHSRMAIASTAVALLLAACNPQQEQRGPANGSASPTTVPTATPLSLRITGKGTNERPVRFVDQKGNRKLYELLARSYESAGSQGNAHATFSDVNVTFYDPKGATLVATAPRAIVDETANTVTLQGGVKGKASTGMLLQCDTLVYSRDTQMFHGEGHVVVSSSQGMRASGNRFDSDISLTHTRMQ
jgi:hypothetical protein